MRDKTEAPEQVNSLMHTEDESANTLRLERIPCPLCNSTKATIVQTSGDNLCGIPGEFSVERCDVCGHLFMNPRPVLECLAACYPDNYGPHQSIPKTTSLSGVESPLSEQGQAKEQARPLILRILPLRFVPGLRKFYYWLIDDRSQPVPPTPATLTNSRGIDARQSPTHNNYLAVEIGCATGQYLVRLLAAGWKATGIEPGVGPATVAKNAGLDVQCGLLETCTLTPESFDLAAAWMVIEHVPDPRDTLKRIHSLLKPGGRFLFSIPNAGCWEVAFFGRNWFVLELPRHLHHFTPASIQKLLEESGFTNIEITHQRNLSNVIGSVALIILSRWPHSRIGLWLFRYPHHPTAVMKLLLAPFAHLLALMKQGGRLTITAVRPEE
jgi:SAM-dependent methyltransferase